MPFTPTSSLGNASSPDLIPKPVPDGGRDQAVQPPTDRSRIGSDGEVRGKPETPPHGFGVLSMHREDTEWQLLCLPLELME